MYTIVIMIPLITKRINKYISSHWISTPVRKVVRKQQIHQYYFY